MIIVTLRMDNEAPLNDEAICQTSITEERDIESATVYNNHKFVSKWLKFFTLVERDEEVYRERCGSLLRRASFCHSVDVVIFLLWCVATWQNNALVNLIPDYQGL